MVSDTQAKVYIKEVGAYLLIHLVNDSLSVLLLGRQFNELGYSYSWPTRETPRLSKYKKVTECSIENFVLMVPVTKQKALERERKEVEDNTWTCYNHLQKDYKIEMHLPQLRQLGVAQSMMLSKNNLLVRNFHPLLSVRCRRYSGKRYQE